MSWIAVLLIGLAVTDLAHSVRRTPVVNECAGAAVAVGLGVLAGLTEIGVASGMYRVCRPERLRARHYGSARPSSRQNGSVAFSR